MGGALVVFALKPALETTCVRVYGEVYGVNDARKEVVRENVVWASEIRAGVHAVGDNRVVVGVETGELTRCGVEWYGGLFVIGLCKVWVMVGTLREEEDTKGVACIRCEYAYWVFAGAVEVGEGRRRPCLQRRNGFVKITAQDVV